MRDECEMKMKENHENVECWFYRTSYSYFVPKTEIKTTNHLLFSLFTMLDPEPISERPWPRKFRDAFRGVKAGVRGQSSFFVHFFMTAAVIVAAVVLGVDLIGGASCLYALLLC